MLLTLRDFIRRRRPSTSLKPGGWLALAALAVITAFVFSRQQPMAFLVLPALLPLIFEFETLGAALGILIVVGIAGICTLNGAGPVAIGRHNTTNPLLVAQLFMAALALTSFPTAAVLSQRRRLQAVVNAHAARTGALYRRAKLAEAVAGVGYWRLEVATGEADWSDIFYEIYGLERGEKSMMTAALARVCPEERDETYARLKQVLREGQEYTYQSKLIWPELDRRAMCWAASRPSAGRTGRSRPCSAPAWTSPT